MKKSKVLFLVNDLNRCNGISTFVMNYYKNIDEKKLQIDFVLCTNDIDSEYKSIIDSKGSKIYIVEFDKSKSLKYNKLKIRDFIKEHADEYGVIHSNLINKGYYYLKYAKKYGIRYRILHSHNMTLGDGNVLKRLLNHYFKFMALNNSNVLFACSDGAGKFLFKNRNFRVINNAFQIEKYKFNEEKRRELRKILKLDNKKVLIQVGRLDYQKDPFYSLELIKHLNDNNVVLLFVGSGEYEIELKQKIEEDKFDNIILLGTRSDVPDLYSASDYFLFPSRFEGLGLSAVEAQISGLCCLISNNVPKEARISNNAYYLDKNDIDSWISVINKDFNDRFSRLEDAEQCGFNIKVEALKLANIYNKMMEGNYED